MLLLVSADPLEFSGFTGLAGRPAGDLRWMATTTIRGVPALLVANGAGRGPAAAGASAAIASNPVEAVVSTGFAGALAPDLAVGSAFLAERILDGGRTYRGSRPQTCPPGLRRGTLVTANGVVQTAEAKARLARAGGEAVDMESAAVAAVAAEHGLPCYCLRAISDSATLDLPVDFNRALRPDGTFSPWSVLGQAALRPARWPALARLRQDAKLAARSLAQCLSRCEFDF